MVLLKDTTSLIECTPTDGHLDCLQSSLLKAVQQQALLCTFILTLANISGTGSALQQDMYIFKAFDTLSQIED